jgi:2-keto-4-pentenoate hydratase/2-oxohepta-3-ene-1,7-dioic acid hydratase in catechol pathway
VLLLRLPPADPSGEPRWAAGADLDHLRLVKSDPLRVTAGHWRWGDAVSSTGVQPLAPVVPRQIVGIGRNYREHAAELGNAMPAEPLLFLKALSSLVGPGDAVALPPESAEVHFEGEVALVIGRRATRVDAAGARAAILGYTAACDVTARDLQNKDRTFARGKGFDTFCPLGPALRLGVPPDDALLVTRINGAERQRATVGEMAWGPVALVEYVSRFFTLEPGDVILTGTPAGVGPLHAGDTVEVEVAGAGVLANPIVARGA